MSHSRKALQNRFGIGVRCESMPALLQLATQLEVVVDFSIEDDSGVAIIGKNRLVASLQVNNLQASRPIGK